MTTNQVRGADLVPDLAEARRLLDCGLKLVQLHPYQKRPLLDGWNRPEHFASVIIDGATGYGVPLAANKLCSVDPDNEELARIGLAALGFNLDQWMAAGVRTRSTRPESGGRSMFLADGEIGWVKFSAGAGTILELRADSPNLQDVVPGLVYRDKDGILRTQSYANGRRYDDAPVLPDDLQEFWERCSTDIEYLHKTQWTIDLAVARHVGDVPSRHFAVSVPKGSGKRLGFSSHHRGQFNARNTVESVLARHGYQQHHHLSRWSRPGATGEPGIRPIPGKDGLWQSDHAGDPLFGTFDAWSAHVVLDHSGDLRAAESAARSAGTIQPSAGLVLTRGDQVVMKDISWAWRGFLAAGALHLLAGRPEAGKTTLAISLAALWTRGLPWPNGAPSEGGSVILWTGEDQIDSVLLPRFVAAGGDCEKIYFITGRKDSRGNLLPFEPAHDLPDLLPAIAAIDDRVMLILDPVISAVAGNTDKAGEVRRALEPLVQTLASTGAFAIGITHVNKGSAGKFALERVLGSGAFVALARVVFMAASDGKEQHIVVRAKSNIGRSGGGFPYSIEKVAIDGLQDEPTRVAWREFVEGEPNQLLSSIEGPDDAEERSALDDCCEMIQDILTDRGATRAAEIESAVKSRGFTIATLKRARQRLTQAGVMHTEKEGFSGGWIWRPGQKLDPKKLAQGLGFSVPVNR